MNVASLELCKELYDLSGWEPNDKYWFKVDGSWKVFCGHEFTVGKELHDFHMVARYHPAYDLSYLLRNLPENTDVHKSDSGVYVIVNNRRLDIRCFTDTPEDAACKLAIELFNQGILHKEPNTHE